MTKTLISVDLDWFNDDHWDNVKDPINTLVELLEFIPKNISTIMTIQHHEFLLQLRRWINSGKIQTPFDILNFDEHHDYYIYESPYDPGGKETHCGNWGYRIPIEWYNRYTWVQNGRSQYYDWHEAKAWMGDHFIEGIISRDRPLSNLKSEIIAAVFCVSPDYLHGNMFEYISKAIETIVDHFGMEKAPLKIKGTKIGSPNGWKITQRPAVLC